MESRPLSWMMAGCAARVAALPGNPPVRRVITDSRAAGPGDLFIALRGERFDGHDFLPELAERGIVAAVVSEAYRGMIPPGLTVLVVADPRTAYGQLAGHYRAEFDLPIVCVGGSNGKTTTKELIAAVLSARFRTLKSEASYNNDVGVPATLFQLELTHTAAVLEAGTNHPGELAPLVRLIAPQIGVLTSFGREHLEFFGDLAGVVREEGSLAEALPAGGTLVLDGDSDCAGTVAARVRPGVQVLRVGFAETNDWVIRDLSQDWDGLTFRAESVSHREWSGIWRVPLPGRHSAKNALCALAVAAVLGVNPAAARPALLNFHPPKQRLAVLRAGAVRVVDDTYNANADSMLASLQTLTDLPCAGRRVAVLGDMGELGFMTETAHVEVGTATAEGVDALFAIGRFAETTVAAARQAGHPHAQAFASIEAALPTLVNYLTEGDTVLVKASRSARLERVVTYLRDRFEAPPPILAAA